MRKVKSRMKLAVAVSAVGLAVTGTAVACAHLYTPTVSIRIDNDTAEQVTLAGCSSDAATLDRGQTVEIDPNANDSRAACVVYQGETRVVLGCLYVPTTVYRRHATIKLSTYRPAAAGAACQGG